jgi:limonene-1,2-epoxide hydrolase
VTTDRETIVRDFIDSWSTRDLDRIMSFIADDCVYHNIPLDPVIGPEAIRKTCEGFAGMATEIEWVLHRIAESSDGCVLTERTDKFKIAEQWVALPVMGSFELSGDKISAWRDYFDLAQFQRQLPGAEG